MRFGAKDDYRKGAKLAEKSFSFAPFAPLRSKVVPLEIIPYPTHPPKMPSGPLRFSGEDDYREGAKLAEKSFSFAPFAPLRSKVVPLEIIPYPTHPPKTPSGPLRFSGEDDYRKGAKLAERSFSFAPFAPLRSKVVPLEIIPYPTHPPKMPSGPSPRG